MDSPDHHIRRNVLLELIAELYEHKLSDSISVKEWLEDQPVEDEPRYTNHYLCPKDDTRWDAEWSCICNDRCPTCDAVVEPYAMTRNADDWETIHNDEVYNRANVVRE